jgi:hypothetical protein
MKSLLFSAIAFCSLPLLAQTAATTSTSTSTTTTTTPEPAPVTAPPVTNPMMQRMLSSLTPDEQNQIIAARTKAMADNPGLETDEMSLMEKGMMLHSDSATEEDKQAFRAELKDHVQKVRDAMLKADPSIQPILAKLEAATAAMQAQHQAAQVAP